MIIIIIIIIVIIIIVIIFASLKKKNFLKIYLFIYLLGGVVFLLPNCSFLCAKITSKHSDFYFPFESVCSSW